MRFGTSIFAEWKQENGRVEARNDRFGFFSLFYKVTDQGIAFSPQIADLVEPGEPLDDAALAVFFRLGFFLGEDTPFARIRALPPNCHLVFESPSRMQISGDITLVPERSIAYDRAVETYAELFHQSVQRRLTSKKFAVPVTGGRDSRHILLELLAQGHRPEFAATVLRFPPFPNDDAVVAAGLCQAIGMEHRVVPQTQSRFQAETRMHQITSFSSDEHEWAISLGDYLKCQGVGAVYDGIAGDILSAPLVANQEHLKLIQAGRMDELAEALLPQAPAVEQCFTADLARRVPRDVALHRLRKELIRHVGAVHPVSSFRFWNRTRREISVIFKILYPVEVITPFLDEDLFFFLASLPPEITLPGPARFHTDTILRTYPNYAGVPFETKGGVAHDFRVYQAYALRTATHIFANPQIRLSYMLPRLLRCAVDPSYAPNVQWLARRTIYHTELRSLALGLKRDT